MNNLFGIITTSLLVCALAGPAWAELSETAGEGEGSPGQGSSTPGSGGGQAAINSLLDRFAGIGFSDPYAGDPRSPSHAIVPPISETTMFSAFTRADSPMNAYYSRSGSDNKENISAISRSAAFASSLGGDRFALPDSGLAAIVQGHFVGSGVVVDGSIIAPIQTASSGPFMMQNNPGNTGFYDVTITTTINAGDIQTPVPLPLPFLLTGSGLVALLAMRKKAANLG
jgi:hypothetical protein